MRRGGHGRPRSAAGTGGNCGVLEKSRERSKQQERTPHAGRAVLEQGQHSCGCPGLLVAGSITGRAARESLSAEQGSPHHAVGAVAGGQQLPRRVPCQAGGLRAGAEGRGDESSTFLGRGLQRRGGQGGRSWAKLRLAAQGGAGKPCLRLKLPQAQRLRCCPIQQRIDVPAEHLQAGRGGAGQVLRCTEAPRSNMALTD